MTAAIDPDRLARLRAKIAEKAPEVAEDFEALADYLQALQPAAPAGGDHLPKARRLPKHTAAFHAECLAIAAAWERHRVSTWPNGKPPPSLNDDYEAAKRDGLRTGDGSLIPRRFIRAARWPDWRRTVGRPKKSAGNQ